MVIVAALAVLCVLAWSTWRKPRLTASIVWALTATLLGAAALALLLPSEIKPTLLWISILTPLLWVAFLVWCHWDARPYRPAVGLFTLTAVCGLVVWAVPPPL